MKSRTTSPQPEVVRLRAFKWESTSTEPPKLQNLEFFPTNMNFGGFAALNPQPESPKTTNGRPLAVTSTPRPDDTPTKPSSDIPMSSPPPSDADGIRSPPQLSSQPGTPSSETGAHPWSGAVGRASIGKTGRVIEKLMSDNDQLRRDQKLLQAKIEEQSKRAEDARLGLDNERMDHRNTKFKLEREEASAERRGQEIKDLKTDLAAERSRRANAEERSRLACQGAQELSDRSRKTAMEAQERSRQAITQYDCLARAWKSTETGYKRQVQKLRGDLKGLEEEITTEKKKVSRQQLLSEQTQLELDRAKDINIQLQDAFEAYKAEQASCIEDLKARAERNGTANEDLLKEIEEVLGKMRYVINVKRDVKGAE